MRAVALLLVVLAAGCGPASPRPARYPGAAERPASADEMAAAIAATAPAPDRAELRSVIVGVLAAPTDLPASADRDRAARDRFDQVAAPLDAVPADQRLALARGLALAIPLRRLALAGLDLGVARYLQVHPERADDAVGFRTPDVERWRAATSAAIEAAARARLDDVRALERALAALPDRPRSCVWLQAALDLQLATTSLTAAATGAWSPAAGDWAGFLATMGEPVRDDTLAADCFR